MILAAVFTSINCANYTKPTERAAAGPSAGYIDTSPYAVPAVNFTYRWAADGKLRKPDQTVSELPAPGSSTTPPWEGLPKYYNGYKQQAGVFNIAGVQTDALNRTFWLRQRMFSNYYNTMLLDSSNKLYTSLCAFRDANGQSLVDIYVHSNKVYITIFNADKSRQTAKVVATLTEANCGYDVATRYLDLDLRINLDSVAGYVQVYNAAGALVGEYLGATVADTRAVQDVVLHNAAGSSCTSGYWNPMFSIVATTTTFGMVVVPMIPKAAGSKQEQDSGAYSAISKFYLGPEGLPASAPVPVTLTSTEKSVTLKTPTTAELAIPANYVVEAVGVAGVYSAVSSKGDGIPIKQSLMFSGDSTVYSKQTDIPIYPNYNRRTQFQAAVSLFNTNPKTSAAWTLADLDAVEIGFTAKSA